MKTPSGQGYESAWLGRWTQLGNGPKKFISPEEDNNVKEGRDSDTTKLQAHPTTSDETGSTSRAATPWMYAQGGNGGGFGRLDFPIQEKTTQNLLELIRPVRIYATIDSIQRVEENGRRPVSMKLKGKLFGGCLDLFPDRDHQQQRKGGGGGGVRLQSLESSEGGQRKDDESTAETDTLETARLHIMPLSGSISSASAKGKGRKKDSAIPRTEIPDMIEPPVVLDTEQQQGESSNSATQTMNADDHYLYRECKRVRLETELEPDSRWVKRLKTNASDSSETKSLVMKTKEASPGLKGNNNNLFLEILKSGINNLQPRNQVLEATQVKNLNKGEEEDITLMHPWIQRWCKKKTGSTEQADGQEVSLEYPKEFEKKQYPSIAAMALMGKALSGLNPYGLRKTKSLVVWNARDLR